MGLGVLDATPVRTLVRVPAIKMKTFRGETLRSGFLRTATARVLGVTGQLLPYAGVATHGRRPQ